jgi:imidazolonepropionase-like amidohydrolase
MSADSIRSPVLIGLLIAAAAPLAAQEPSMQVHFGNRPKEYKVAILGPDRVASPAYAFKARKLLPIEGDPIDDGIVLTKDGKIVAIGKASETAIPAGFEVVDLGDTWCVPGLVEVHCHIAGKSSDINDMVHQTNPEMRTLDLVTMDHEQMKDALAGGVTTVNYIPGSGTNMGGFGTLTKTWGHSPQEALVRFPGCLKIAQAGNPERHSGDLGMTPMGMNQGLRFTLERGRAYYQAWEDFDAGKGPKPELAPGLEYLRGLFRHEYPVCVHTQIYQVVLQTIRQLRHEFGLWAVIVHGEFDAYRLSEFAADSGVPVASGPREYHFDSGRGWGAHTDRPSSFAGLAVRWYEGGQYGFRKKQRGLGVDGIGVNTDSPVVPQHELSLQCAMAVRLGLPDTVGIRALTINPARFMGVDHRVGSLVVGKDADLGFWSGDPIDPRSYVEATVVNGNLAYRRSPTRPRF